MNEAVVTVLASGSFVVLSTYSHHAFTTDEPRHWFHTIIHQVNSEIKFLVIDEHRIRDVLLQDEVLCKDRCGDVPNVLDQSDTITLATNTWFDDVEGLLLANSSCIDVINR